MHLLRVQVPDFRVLKDVDLTFEKEFTPKVFPLGSQNGGGKSTLLQLIFVLLHCPNNSDKLFALKNILYGFKVRENTRKRVLAVIDVWVNNKRMRLDFFSCKNFYISQAKTASNLTNSKQENDDLNFSMMPELEDLKKRITRLAQERTELENTVNDLEIISGLKDDSDRYFQFTDKFTDRLDKLDIKSIEIREKKRLEKAYVREIQKNVAEQLESLESNYSRLYTESIKLSHSVEEITEYLKSENLIYIVNYSSEGDKNEDEVLLCHVNDLDLEEAKLLLDELSKRVFLAVPSTQMFLFLPQEARKSLFREQNKRSSSDTYHARLKEAKLKLTGLFTYDFLAVDLLIDSFKAARDEDFKEAIETGKYGDSYKALLSNLNSMLANKQINLKSDLSGVTFKIGESDEAIELYPEDLSHGELKRLSVYMWLKYRNIEDSLVLMDEIEIALHPDWQYRIVSDLTQWSPNNQYILATHSYELCQALTPSHVKELEPKLLKQSQK